MLDRLKLKKKNGLPKIYIIKNMDFLIFLILNVMQIKM